MHMGLLQEWYLHETINSENDMFHRPQNEEMSFYYAVSDGDIDFVRENCRLQRFAATDGVGTLSKDPVTNLKYHFVVTAAFITRLCSQAGMEMEQAYRLSDFYILKLDNLHTKKDIIRLHDTMVLDFTEKMRILRNYSNTSKPVSECIEYIYVHIKERITIEDLAEHTRLSTNYLSRLFKKEIGVPVSDYIREKKIETAQNMLKYCDYSLIEIANYLSFSSQSHFIQSFKKIVGLTPKKYRDLYYCTNWTVEQTPPADTAEQ